MGEPGGRNGVRFFRSGEDFPKPGLSTPSFAAMESASFEAEKLISGYPTYDDVGGFTPQWSPLLSKRRRLRRRWKVSAAPRRNGVRFFRSGEALNDSRCPPLSNPPQWSPLLSKRRRGGERTPPPLECKAAMESASFEAEKEEHRRVVAVVARGRNGVRFFRSGEAVLLPERR